MEIAFTLFSFSFSLFFLFRSFLCCFFFSFFLVACTASNTVKYEEIFSSFHIHSHRRWSISNTSKRLLATSVNVFGRELNETKW